MKAKDEAMCEREMAYDGRHSDSVEKCGLKKSRDWLEKKDYAFSESESMSGLKKWYDLKTKVEKRKGGRREIYRREV